MAFKKMKNLLGKTIEVPSGAVKSYESLGFVLDGTVPTVVEETTQKTEETQEPEADEDAAFVQELEKKPLAQWSANEVKRYASICGVDISGTKNAQEAKERIKAYIDEKAE